ncbi:hypothetical protein LCGC14_3093140 [marine sediment metagenome]|uniref:Uncharacterized protein n=1 Tax=marine sediment metagenome TaxID=412755 RepID=A0A0F8WYS1_9ZZZZ
MNNKGGVQTFVILILLIILTGACLDYYLETKGQNTNKVDFCEDLGYETEYEISFFFNMICYKIEDGIRNDYVVKDYNFDNNTSIKYKIESLIGLSDKKHSYYLKEV